MVQTSPLRRHKIKPNISENLISETYSNCHEDLNINAIPAEMMNVE